MRAAPTPLIDHNGENEGVTPFLTDVLREGRAPLSTGFCEGAYRSRRATPASIALSFWTEPGSPFWCGSFTLTVGGHVCSHALPLLACTGLLPRELRPISICASFTD